jgi:hypothetical protein
MNPTRERRRERRGTPHKGKEKGKERKKVIPYVFGNISSIALLGGLLHWAATGIHHAEEKG